MYTITAAKRDPGIKAKQLRRSGFVPCVIYGAGLGESMSVRIDAGTARQLRRDRRCGSKVSVLVEGSAYPALIRELKCSPMNGEVIHVSFLVPDAAKKIGSIADIVLLNRDKVPGVLEQIRMQVPHAALPQYLLDTVEVDLEDMPIGTALTIGDIPEFTGGNIELLADPGSIVLRISGRKRAAYRAAEQTDRQ